MFKFVRVFLNTSEYFQSNYYMSELDQQEITEILEERQYQVVEVIGKGGYAEGVSLTKKPL